MVMLTKDVEVLAKVKKGRQRRLVIEHIDHEKPLLVSEIQRKANLAVKKTGDGKEIRLSDISRTLSILMSLGVVECLNPRKKVGDNGILYKLTPKGKKIKKAVIE